MTPLQRNGLIAVIAVIALASGFAASHWWRQASAPKTPEVNMADFSLPDLEGKQRWLSEWQDKVIVLNFWATWCAPCIEEIPLLMAVHKRYENKGIQVIGIAIDSADAVLPFIKKLRVTYSQLLAEEAGLDIMAHYGNAHGSLPYTVIIGRNGKTLAKKLGAYKPGELEIVLDSLENTTPPELVN
jgi:thiol-disulfide isomerase/thioredoxin